MPPRTGAAMDCLDAKQMLEPCARGQLSATDKADLDRHVATCEGCRLELELTRAVLGSSSESADDPALVDPVLMEADSDPVSFDTVEEPTIEQERLPRSAPEGPGPPRVLISQLPEESEEDLDLASSQPSAYDPGAIDLPHQDQTSKPSAVGESASEGSISEVAAGFDEKVSFDDLATDSPTLPTPAPAVSGAHVAPASGVTGKTGTATWGFEPVDVPRTSAPPEESLTFAKEALDRQRGNASRGKRQARLLLWIGAAVGGVGLLGASVWMALAFREPAGSEEPSNVPAVQPPPGGPFPPNSSDSLPPSTEQAPGVTATDSIASPPQPTPVIKAGAAAGATGTGAIAPLVANAKQPVPKQAPIKPADGARSGTSTGATAAPTNPNGSATSGKSSASPAPAAATFRDDELAPAPRREPQILKVEPDAKPGDAGYGEADGPVAEPPPKPVITAPIFVPPSSGTSSASGKGTSAGTDSGSGPLDRLHTATVTAQKNQDLEALRQLKATWKSTMRSATAQERSRSKREYADCLWAIQEITKRDADRKEALAAYREYVLHAPAGGADARTVSRMRHLEDILSDAQ